MQNVWVTKPLADWARQSRRHFSMIKSFGKKRKLKTFLILSSENWAEDNACNEETALCEGIASSIETHILIKMNDENENESARVIV